ncbi:MAG: hypothetical protein A2W97_04300 [Bacteroidetes bacterium GWE2_40_63]|jgi:hypothetical protein|nr:MAG: hypothetical protein A2W96_14555 [Bacteroidetes bacterium GWD2_40_43]OFX91430.1 MAG: hypothetical protein A2W97_04300 [Bacteroidetes bacterium GWE2_40_63]OFY19499.1 MAG: hypothetical protein A2W88_02180 [Bacteroidetes bacterium GWF2_40_13]HAZ04834.1 hypothetical protein [Marinilabiliales bacterium]HBO76099.1 hypothetical protein [Marinilabiliales bacterium]
MFEFYEYNKSLLINWLPEKHSISTLDYFQSIDEILFSVSETRPEKILIDLSDCDFPMVIEEMIRFLSFTLAYNPAAIQLGLVNSHGMYGQIAISNILKRLEEIKLKIRFFKTTEEGFDWFIN